MKETEAGSGRAHAQRLKALSKVLSSEMFAHAIQQRRRVAGKVGLVALAALAALAVADAIIDDAKEKRSPNPMRDELSTCMLVGCY